MAEGMTEEEQRFDDAKRFLQKEPPLGGSSLHDHLTQVVLKLIVERPDDANPQFEQLSLALRTLSAEKLAKAAADAAAAAAAAEAAAAEAAAVAPEPEVEPELDENGEPIKPKKKKPVQTGPLTPEEALKAKVSAWIASHAYLFPVPEKPEPEEGAEEEEEPEEPEEDDPGDAGPISEVLDDAVLWSWAGIGFGETQTFRLFRSLQLLAGREGGECTIRFWGKVLGRQGDYFVACALTEQTSTPDPFEADEETEEKIHFMMPPGQPTDFEAEGLDGPNKWTYWVALDPSGGKKAWTKLPHVTPEQIVAARAHRKFLTGDLASPVACFPPLPGGTEAHLLRAYIAEITCDCSLGLAGLFEPDEDGLAEEPPIVRVRPVEEEDDESAKYFTSTELKMLETWVHTEAELRANGRCQVKPPPDEDEEGGGGEGGDLDEKKGKFFAAFGAADASDDSDPSVLKTPAHSIAEDLDRTSGKSQWAVRVCPSGAATTPNSFAVCRSLKWPGAYTVAAGYQSPATPAVKHRRRLTSVYVGHGVPRSANPVSLQMPKPVCTEASVPPDEQADVVVEPPKEEEDE